MEATLPTGTNMEQQQPVRDNRDRRRNRHNKKNWNRKKNNNAQETAKKPDVLHAAAIAEHSRIAREISAKLQQEQEGNREALKVFRLQKPVCPRCNNIIQELSSALSDRNTGEPVHFECVLELIKRQENCAPSEKIAYIGQGRFAVMYYANPSDIRHFSIRRIIEWESHDKPSEWRGGIAGLFSQV
jgi:hypothetical protein